LKLTRPEIPHEVLGCALLQGPPGVATFESIRVGSSILSDLGNEAESIAAAAAALGVEERVAHIVRLGFEFDTNPEYWSGIWSFLPIEPSDEEVAFLPGVSRLSIEMGMTGMGRGFKRVWLRSAWAR